MHRHAQEDQRRGHHGPATDADGSDETTNGGTEDDISYEFECRHLARLLLFEGSDLYLKAGR